MVFHILYSNLISSSVPISNLMKSTDHTNEISRTLILNIEKVTGSRLGHKPSQKTHLWKIYFFYILFRNQIIDLRSLYIWVLTAWYILWDTYHNMLTIYGVVNDSSWNCPRCLYCVEFECMLVYRFRPGRSTDKFRVGKCLVNDQNID